MRRQILQIAAAVALIAGSIGSAQAQEGWYGRADVGYSIDGATEIENVELDHDDNWLGDVGVGYAYPGTSFRTEAELAYRVNDAPPLTDDITAKSLLVNVFYDFNRAGRFQPYVGLGLGAAEVEVAGDDDTGWAWQALAGVGVALTERLTLDLGYRYFAAPDLDLFGGDADYEHQAITAGLRFQFAAPPPPVTPAPLPAPAPPPPPPPPPAPCPQADFVVYFEWDRSALNQAAIEVIDSAVARAQQCNVSGAVVVGHTDTSGSTAYNQGLSERRAAVVRDALVARGLPAGLVSTQARGETDLARATRDGVREPLNRRTAVTISFR